MSVGYLQPASGYAEALVAGGSAPMIDLLGVGVRYRLPRNGTRSLKEYALLSLRRKMTYDEFWALRKVDLRVFPGERLGVVGRNGAGKSTLLQVVARVMPPTRGTVVLRGRIAPLLQLGAGFDPELTGRENVLLNGVLLGLRPSQVQELFDSIVEFAELEDFIDMPLRTYSSGMWARLGFAVATASPPDVFLLDEVLAVGDAAFTKRCLARATDFSERGTTMVVVAHDMSLIREHCTRAIWVEAGNIRADGDPERVVDAYEDFMARRLWETEQTSRASAAD
jgi:ABC-2 type transport system ATP-binding protein